MKIAIYHNLPSGGAKRALYEITKRLSLKHGVDVYTLSTADHSFLDLTPFCKHHKTYSFKPLPLLRSPLGRINQLVRTLDLERLRILQRTIARDVDQKQYDLIFVNHCQFGQSPTILQYLETPSIYYCHEPPRQIYETKVQRTYIQPGKLQNVVNYFDPTTTIYRKRLTRVDRVNVSKAKLVLTNSSYSRERILNVYGISAKIAKLGVDAELFRPVPCTASPQILSVGALTPIKGFEFLINCHEKLQKRLDLKLRIVSNYIDKDELNYLMNLVNKKGLDVSVQNGITDSELVMAYNKSLITVYAPIMEPFGFVPLESMACGKPVIGVSEGGVCETIIDGQTGILVERDVDIFSDAVSRLVADNKARIEMGNRARVHVTTNWTWDRSIENIENLFQSTPL